MEHGYLLHSKGAWKNHAYVSKVKKNGKWYYYYKTSTTTSKTREQDAKINKSLSPVYIKNSKQEIKSKEEAAKAGQLGAVESAQQKSAAYNKGMEYLRRYNKTSDRLPEVQLAKRRAAEEARAKEEAANQKNAAKASAPAAETGKGSGKAKATKEKKEKAAKVSSGGSSSGSSKEAATATPQQNQISEAEQKRLAEEEKRLEAERKEHEEFVKNASVEELAMEVMLGKMGNGQERIDKLGSRYSEVQAYVNKLMKRKKLGGR